MPINLHGPLTRLHDALRAAGIPIDGVRPTTRGTSAGPGNVTVDFNPSATAAQRTQAANIVAAHNWTVRTRRPVTAIAADIETWITAPASPVEQIARLRKVAAMAVALAVAANPQLARQSGIPVDGDA